MTAEKPMSQTQIAKHYGCATRTIRRWMEQGLVPFVRVGHPRFYLSEVEAALRRHGLIKAR